MFDLLKSKLDPDQRFRVATFAEQIGNEEMSADDVGALIVSLADALRNLLSDHPVFRSKPMGAPNSDARRAQERAIKAEEEAKAVLRLLGGQ